MVREIICKTKNPRNIKSFLWAQKKLNLRPVDYDNGETWLFVCESWIFEETPYTARKEIAMSVVMNSKSPFYQLVYSVDGKRTTVSTKTKNEKKALRFLANFEKQNLELIPLTLSQFQEEYLQYIQITKSIHYI